MCWRTFLSTIAVASQGVSNLPAVTLDEFCESFQLLFDEIASGVVFQIARFVIEPGRAAADEDFGLVQSQSIQEHQHSAQIVLNASSAEGRGRGRLDSNRLVRERLVL